MRDKKRIKRNLKLIEDIWNANPDQRFGQLLENLIRFGNLFDFKYEKYVLVPFLWGQEDDITEKRLKEASKLFIPEVKK